MSSVPCKIFSQSVLLYSLQRQEDIVHTTIQVGSFLWVCVMTDDYIYITLSSLLLTKFLWTVNHLILAMFCLMLFVHNQSFGLGHFLFFLHAALEIDCMFRRGAKFQQHIIRQVNRYGYLISDTQFGHHFMIMRMTSSHIQS